MRIEATLAEAVFVRHAIAEAIDRCAAIKEGVEPKPPIPSNFANFNALDDDSTGVVMSFDFQGIEITVTADSDPELVYLHWEKAFDAHEEARLAKRRAL